MRPAALSLMAILLLTYPAVQARFSDGAERPHARQQVTFAKGDSNTTIKGAIKGYEIVDYLLDAAAGQMLHVRMTTDSGANYFNLMAPNEKDIAFFIGSIHGSSYQGMLPDKGNYTIRVYQMRSAARRNETAHYALDISISGAEILDRQDQVE